MLTREEMKNLCQYIIKSRDVCKTYIRLANLDMEGKKDSQEYKELYELLKNQIEEESAIKQTLLSDINTLNRLCEEFDISSSHKQEIAKSLDLLNMTDVRIRNSILDVLRKLVIDPKYLYQELYNIDIVCIANAIQVKEAKGKERNEAIKVNYLCCASLELMEQHFLDKAFDFTSKVPLMYQEIKEDFQDDLNNENFNREVIIEQIKEMLMYLMKIDDSYLYGDDKLTIKHMISLIRACIAIMEEPKEIEKIDELIAATIYELDRYDNKHNLSDLLKAIPTKYQEDKELIENSSVSR